MMLFDWQRCHRWKPVWWQRAMTCAALSAILGILIEFAQANMHMGRGFEIEDMVADTVGAFVFAVFWMIFQKSWMP